MNDRINKYKKRTKENSANSYNDDENIFFDFSEGKHRIRLIREWVSVHSHWIAHSQYSKVNLYDESHFKGDNRLKKNVNCPDFDINTETDAEESTCTICHLREAANDLLYECQDLDDRQKKFLEDIAHDCAPTERTFFLCIDRDNPEIAPGKKGFKIIEFPAALMSAWMQLVESNPDLDLNSDDEGVDFLIAKLKEKGRNKYTIEYVMKGAKACQTPLTEEERGYTVHDIKKIMCKMPDQEALYDKLRPEFKELLDDRQAAMEESFQEKEEEKTEKVSLPKRNKGQTTSPKEPDPEDAGGVEGEEDMEIPF